MLRSMRRFSLLLAAFIIFFSQISGAEVRLSGAGKQLSGHTFVGVRLCDLRLADTVIRDMVFEDVVAGGAHFRNIIFENCRFSRVDLSHSTFENVVFRNCALESGKNADDTLVLTTFEGSSMKDVLFEQSRLYRVRLAELQGAGGKVSFKKMTDIVPEENYGLLLSGQELRICVEDSQIRGGKIKIHMDEKNKSFLIARNSIFSRFSVYCDAIFMQNCTIADSRLGAAELIVRDSSLSGAEVLSTVKGYLVYNLYSSGKGGAGNSAHALGKGKIYVLHRDPAPAHLSLGGGNLEARDIVLASPILGSKAGEVTRRLDLRNVQIKGGSWRYLRLLSGQWENVVIEPPVIVDKSRLENVAAYNLQFPQGEPWSEVEESEGPLYFGVTRRPTPFAWEEVHVPEPEDWGIAWRVIGGR